MVQLWLLFPVLFENNPPEALMRFELMTPGLRDQCSATELQGHLLLAHSQQQKVQRNHGFYLGRSPGI